jgi:apolipoprotein N-acyltransferase
MRFLSLRSWCVVLLSSLLQIASFPVAGPLTSAQRMLGWIALTPLLYVLLQKQRSGRPLTLRQSLIVGYVAGIGWYLGNCYWIYQTMYLYGGLPKPVALGILVLFALYLGLYHALFAGLLSVLRRSSLGLRGALLLTPFLWVAVELARSRITGFPWDLLGYTQVDNLFLTRLGPITGVMGLSFLLALVNAAIVSGFFLEKTRSRVIWSIAAISVLAMQCAAYLPVRPAQPDKIAVMMQENLSVGAVGRQVIPLTPAQEYQVFSNLSLHPESYRTNWIRSSTITHPDVVVWPEAPSHLESSDPNFRAHLGDLARTAQSPIIAGSLGVDFTNSSARGYYLYDSAAIFDRTGIFQGRYDKIHLVPWGEYVPFKGLFAFAQKLTEGVGDMDRGHARSVFALDGHTYGTFICYESIFGDEVREFVHNGAEVLVNISDDGWYGDTGAPWQHLNMARMRAIENHRWVLRSTNTGVTTAIDPRGRIIIEAPRHIRAAFALPYGFEQDQTLYTRFGDWFAYLCTLVTLIALGYGFVRKMD